jgi:hypothetical protein
VRDYGKVFSRIWESADFRALSEDGRALVLYLLTCTHGTIAGVFRLPDGYACEDLQWSSERVAEGFSNVSSMGFADRCETTKWVWVRKFLEWNPPENPNQRKAAKKIALGVPDQSAWKQAFMRVCGPLLDLQTPSSTEPPANPSTTVPQPVTVTVAVAGTEAVHPFGVGAAANGSGEAPAAGAAATKGSRLFKDWKLPKAWGEWALGKYPAWSTEKVRDEADKFRNHWTSKTGKDATKLDWYATWQNWCMSSIAHKDDPRPAGGPSSAPTADEANSFLAAQAAIPKPDAELARRARERFVPKRQAAAVEVEGEAS